MPVVIVNEKSGPYIFEAGRNGKTIQSGEITTVSDDEWNSVQFSQRGPGKLNPLWPSETTSESLKLQFDYYLVNGVYEIQYLGSATQATLAAADRWTVKKFTHDTLGGTNIITQIQVLQNVAWDDRVTLPWT